MKSPFAVKYSFCKKYECTVNIHFLIEIRFLSSYAYQCFHFRENQLQTHVDEFRNINIIFHLNHFRLVLLAKSATRHWLINLLLQKILWYFVHLVMMLNLRVDAMPVATHFDLGWKKWNIKPKNGMTNVSNAWFVNNKSEANLLSFPMIPTFIVWAALKKSLPQNVQSVKRSWPPEGWHLKTR